MRPSRAVLILAALCTLGPAHAPVSAYSGAWTQALPPAIGISIAGLYTLVVKVIKPARERRAQHGQPTAPQSRDTAAVAAGIARVEMVPAQGKPHGAPLALFENGDGLFGYRRADGTVAIEPKYMLAEEFLPAGIAAAATNQSWAWIDTTGATRAVAFLFDNGPDPFSDGLCRVVRDGRTGFMDVSGRIVVEPRFAFASQFAGGHATFCEACSTVSDGEHRSIEGGRWGAIGRNGTVVVAPEYDWAEPLPDRTIRVRRGDTSTVLTVSD